MVYLSETPALAMLETLVHFEMAPDEVPSSYQLLEVEYTGRKGVSRLAEETLQDEWRGETLYCRTIGDEWLSGLNSCLLKVPSAIVPHSFNYLLNPRHELAANATILSLHSHPYDARLF